MDSMRDLDDRRQCFPYLYEQLYNTIKIYLRLFSNFPQLPPSSLTKRKLATHHIKPIVTSPLTRA